MPATAIVDKIKRIFSQRANEVFLIEEASNTQLTYQEFFQLALQASQLLSRQGIKSTDRVTIILVNSIEFAAMYFGALILGAVAVPINQALHPKEISFILSNSGIRLAVFSLRTRHLVSSASTGISCPQLCLLLRQEKALHGDEKGLVSLELSKENASFDLQQAFQNLTDDSIFTITFTSGTTSKPKGVVHTVGSQFGSAIAFDKELGIGERNRYINFWPMAYSSGILNNLLCPLMAGGSVVISDIFDVQKLSNFWDAIKAYQVNTIWFSPSMLAALNYLDRGTEGISYCNENDLTICVGTAPLPLKVKNDFENKYKVTIYESYGLSETLFISTNSKNYPQKERSVGRIIEGIEVRVEDSSDQPSGVDQEGEIVLRSPFMMKGYFDFGSVHLTQTLPLEEVFKTGDLGKFDVDGNLFITGRKKDLIIRGGMNISPRAIEEVILTHPAVKECCVFGIPHDFYGEEIVAVVKCKEGHDFDEERFSILKLCRSSLNDASVPSKLLLQEGPFPFTNTGKIQKFLVREKILQMNELKT